MVAESEYSDGKKFPAVKRLVDDAGNILLMDQQTAEADTALTVITGVVSVTTSVDSSAGGTAQTANCALIPAGSLLLNVEAKVVTPMDGDATTTLEVGVSGNIDDYIDTVDFDPAAAADTVAGSAAGTNNNTTTVAYLGAATQVIATWTNDASAGAGDTLVTVHYIPLANSDLTDLGATLNSLLAKLRTFGALAT